MLNLKREIEILLKATDKASAVIDKVRGKLDGLRQGAEGGAGFSLSKAMGMTAADAGRMDQVAQRSSRSLLGMAAAAASVGIVVQQTLGRVTRFIDQQSRLGDEMEEMSQRTGQTVERLSELGFMAQRSGLDIHTLEQGLKFLSRSMDEARQGSEDKASAFRRLGIDVTSAAGKTKDANAVLLEMADGMQRLGSHEERVNVAMTLMSRNGTQMLPVFAQGSKGIAEMRDRVRELGGVMSTGFSASSSRMQDAIGDLRTAWGAFKREFSSGFIEDPRWAKIIAASATVLGRLAGGRGSEAESAGPMDGITQQAQAQNAVLQRQADLARQWASGMRPLRAMAEELGITLSKKVFQDGGIRIVEKDQAELLAEVNAELAKMDGITAADYWAELGGTSGVSSRIRDEINKWKGQADWHRQHAEKLNIPLEITFEQGDLDQKIAMAAENAKAQFQQIEQVGVNAFTSIAQEMLVWGNSSRSVADLVLGTIRSMAAALIQVAVSAAIAAAALRKMKQAAAGVALNPLLGAVSFLFNRGGTVPLRAASGMVVPDGPRGFDSVPALLTPGEGVVRRETMGRLERMLSAFENGMFISPYALAGSGGGGGTTVFNFNTSMPVSHSDGLRLAEAARSADREYRRRYLG